MAAAAAVLVLGAAAVVVSANLMLVLKVGVIYNQRAAAGAADHSLKKILSMQYHRRLITLVMAGQINKVRFIFL